MLAEELVMELQLERRRTEAHLAALNQAIAAFDLLSNGARRPISEGQNRERSYRLAYRLMRRGRVVETGQGRTVNLSSSVIHIATETAVPIGFDIEVLIAWPARIDERVPLNLHVRGRTLRAEGNRTAVEIRHHEFRTRRQIQGDSEALSFASN